MSEKLNSGETEQPQVTEWDKIAGDEPRVDWDSLQDVKQKPSAESFLDKIDREIGSAREACWEAFGYGEMSEEDAEKVRNNGLWSVIADSVNQYYKENPDADYPMVSENIPGEAVEGEPIYTLTVVRGEEEVKVPYEKIGEMFGDDKAAMAEIASTLYEPAIRQEKEAWGTEEEEGV